MLTILPLASSLNPPEQIHATVTRLSARLAARRISHEIAAPDARDLRAVRGG